MKKKLRNAYDWLLKNNPLYRDLGTFLENLNYDISQIVHIENKRSFSSWKIVKKKSDELTYKIICGAYHQGSIAFFKEYPACLGKHGFAISVFSILFHLIKENVKNWNSNDLDVILSRGNEFYRNNILFFGKLNIWSTGREIDQTFEILYFRIPIKFKLLSTEGSIKNFLTLSRC